MQASITALRSALLFCALAVGVAACSGGEWVDTEVGDCQDLEDEQVRADMEEWAFPQICEGLGRSYAEEWRCSSGTVEIKCK